MRKTSIIFRVVAVTLGPAYVAAAYLSGVFNAGELAWCSIAALGLTAATPWVAQFLEFIFQD